MKNILSPSFRFLPILLLMVLCEILYLSLYSSLFESNVLYVSVSIISSFIFVVIWLVLRSSVNNNDRTLFWITIAAGIIFRLTLIPKDPIGSDDIYRYLWDGKVQAHGFNPYQYAPTDSALQTLHSADIPRLINFPGMKTVYPPLSEWIFLLSYSIFGETIIGFKILIFLFELANIWLIIKLLRFTQTSDIFASLYVLCPLPILQFSLEAHVDVFAFPFLLLFVLFFKKRKIILSGLSLGLAVAVKLLPALALPAIVYKLPSRRSLLATVLVLTIVVGSYLPYIVSGGTPFESLRTYSTNWEANSSIFLVILEIVRNNQSAHAVSIALIVLFILVTSLRKKEIIDQLYTLIFGALLLSATVHVWYVTWIAILLPFTQRNSGILFVTFISLATIPIIQFHTMGVWHQSVYITIIEYLPVILFFILEEVTLTNRAILQSKQSL